MSKDYEINWSYISYHLEAVGLVEDWNGLLLAKLNWQLRCNNFKRIRHHPPGCSIHLEAKMFVWAIYFIGGIHGSDLYLAKRMANFTIISSSALRKICFLSLQIWVLQDQKL